MLSPVTTPVSAAPPLIPAELRWKRLSSEVMPLTRQVLDKFRAIESGVLERELNERRIKTLHEKIMAGQAITFLWVIADILKPVKTTVRGNGFHSSTMLDRFFPGELPPGLLVNLEHYEVEDKDRFAELFAQFDSKASVRTPDDIAGVFQGIHPELADIDRKDAKQAVDGYHWFMTTVEAARMPIGDMKYSAFGDAHLHPFIKWVASVLTGKTNELRRKEVIGAMFATFNVNETAAREFWDQVSQGGDRDQPDQPETALDKWLLAQIDKEIDRVNGKELFQGCIYCWNRSREGARVTTVRHDVKKNVLTARD